MNFTFDSLDVPETDEPEITSELDFADVQAELNFARCAHEHTTTEFVGPRYRNGSGPVVLVCEDCGWELGQAGWDSVL